MSSEPFTPAMYTNPALRRYHGLSMFVPAERTREHLLMLKGPPYYMSNRRIGELAGGLCESNLSQIISGIRGAVRDHAPVTVVHRATEAAILSVTPRVEEHGERGGGRVPPLGTRRRLQALVAAGYPMSYLSSSLDWGSDPQPVHRITTGKAAVNYVYASTDAKTRKLYNKLHLVKPEDMGFTSYARKRAASAARKRGWAPPHCWDDDTIDDPDALPEWTGRCGSRAGYSLHYKYQILPPCRPCYQAKNARDKRNGN